MREDDPQLKLEGPKIEAKSGDITTSEIRTAVAAALGGAFGFIIALMWKEVVMTGFAIAGIDLSADGSWTGWIVLVVITLALTIFMVILILMITRWGNRK